MRFSFFKSLALTAVVALEANAATIQMDDIYDDEYDLAQIMVEDEELSQPAQLTQTTVES